MERRAQQGRWMHANAVRRGARSTKCKFAKGIHRHGQYDGGRVDRPFTHVHESGAVVVDHHPGYLTRKQACRAGAMRDSDLRQQAASGRALVMTAREQCANTGSDATLAHSHD